MSEASLCCLLLAVAALLVAACSPSSLDEGEVSLPPKNEDRWVMPLDEFTWTAAPLRDYAEALLEKDCYAESGIDWPVPWQPVDRNLGPSVSAGMQVIFNEELAARYGYHRAPQENEARDAWLDFFDKADRVAASAPGFESVKHKCIAQAREVIPLPSDEARDYAVTSAAQLREEALLAGPVAGAAEQWSRCMSDAGYGGLASGPDQMPPMDKAEVWQVGLPFTDPGPEEIAVARADAACRTSSGWTSTLYATVWDLQVEHVNKNSARLIRIREALQEEEKMLLQAVNEHAPEPPR